MTVKPRWRTGYFHPAVDSAVQDGSTGGGRFPGTIPTGTCWVLPLYIPAGRSIGITKLGLYNEDTTADTTRVRMGIYELDAVNMTPTSLIVDAGTITKDTTAVTTIVLTSGSPFTEVTLGPDKMYYTAIVLEVAQTAAHGWVAHQNLGPAAAVPVGLKGDNSAGDIALYPSVGGTSNSAFYTGVSTSGLPSSLSTGYPIGDTAGSRAPQPWMYVNSVSYSD